MPPFPRTYGVVRGGSAETVTVGDVEALLELRTELELILQFGAGVTAEMVAALDARLGEPAWRGSSQRTATKDDVADMRSILTDAQAAANVLAVACIDADFQDIKRALNMSAIEKESEQFQQEVAEVVAGAPVSDGDASEADGQAEASAEATSEATPTIDAPQAGGSEPTAEARDTVVSEQEVEAAAEALEELAAEAENELDAIASGFEEAANELTDPAATDADDVDTLLESMEVDLAATDAPDSETVDDAFEAFAQTSEASDAGASDQETFDPFAADETATADEPEQTVGVVDSTATVTEPITPTFSGSAQAKQGCGGLRGQIVEIRQNLIFQIDRLAEVLDGAADMQEQVRKIASQAAQFKEAAEQAQEASRKFAAAQAEVDQARSEYEQAEARVAEARRAWETAQHTAAEAAQKVQANA